MLQLPSVCNFVVCVLYPITTFNLPQNEKKFPRLTATQDIPVIRLMNLNKLQQQQFQNSLLNAETLKEYNIRNPFNPIRPIKIYGAGTELKFPPFLEIVLQRVQSYFSIYKYPDNSRPGNALVNVLSTKPISTIASTSALTSTSSSGTTNSIPPTTTNKPSEHLINEDETLNQGSELIIDNNVGTNSNKNQNVNDINYDNDNDEIVIGDDSDDTPGFELRKNI